MPEKKVFTPPLGAIKFLWENGQDQTVQQVTERTIVGAGADMLIVMKTLDGGYQAVRGWSHMEQPNGESFF
jgi:hypothetical protein